jgi:hypothetical protein|tara:strand:+ start:1937 stop:2221 length:285 start_codon:yes stop_codon:yes gene_type:complete
MELNKKITSCIWDKCAKQIVEGYVYVKMDDIIKLDLNKEDLIVDNLEIKPKVITKEIIVKEELNMDLVANYLINNGFKYQITTDGKTKSWTKTK